MDWKQKFYGLSHRANTVELALIKTAIKHFMWPLYRNTPETETRDFTVTKVLDKVFNRLDKALEYEKTKGIYSKIDRKINPRKYHVNMEQAIKTLRKILVYVSEADPYYRYWLAHLLMVVTEEMELAMLNFNPAEDPDMKHIPELETIIDLPGVRRKLFTMHLQDHLMLVDPASVSRQQLLEGIVTVKLDKEKGEK